MKISFLGAAKTVTGSKYLIEQGGRQFLIDCGLFQGLKHLRLKNWNSLEFEASKIEFVLLTHAHIDHSGFLPRLVRDGFRGKIICTEATFDLVKILLPDSAHIMEEEANYANRKGYSKHSPAKPLFDLHDVNLALNFFQTIKYDAEIKLDHDLFVTFQDAGHILGSSSVLLHDKRKGIRVGFSGDLGRMHDPILHAPRRFENLNYLVMESTYGDRCHDSSDPAEALLKVIKETYALGGSVIIPAFAVGRTQSILYYLSLLKKRDLLPPMPIFLNSPMASNVSEIYCRYADLHTMTEDHCGETFGVAQFIRSTEESVALNRRSTPMIVISASGMATGGRVLHHLRRFLPEEKNTILFTGFQAEGTRGAKLVNGAKTIKIHGEECPVKAKIINIHSLSAHADQSEILSWLRDSPIDPKKVFVTHGEEVASLALAEKIEDTLHWKCVIPNMNESYEL